MTAGQRLRALGAILALAWPGCASAEHISTFWKLEPTEKAWPTQVQNGKPVFTQRLLPIGLVALTEPTRIGNETFAAGSLFFKVFNDEGKTGYCPAPGRRPPAALAMFKVPILNQHPCLVDTDKDGRFDAVFSAFEQAGGVPTYRGSINGAKPLSSPVGFQPEDVHAYPNDLSISLVLSGRWPKAVDANVEFSRNILSTYKPIVQVVQDGEARFEILNVRMKVTDFDGDTARLALSVDKDMGLLSDWGLHIIWRHPPPGALAD